MRIATPLVGICLVAAMALGLSSANTHIVMASDPIVLDGVFTDWAGEGNITDPTGDGGNRGDITRFWWADNEGGSYLYWRVDRITANKGVTYIVYVDTNNNGVFTENVDREVVVDYDPQPSSSVVDVTVRFADTDGTISQLLNQDWGEDDAEAGRFVEFRASFADLGIVANQTIRFYLESFNLKKTNLQDRAPDAGDIQYSPVNILGYPLLGALVALGTLLIWRFRGRCAWARQ